MAQVTIYTTPTCVYCKMTKEFFKENNIEYKEIDVSSNQEAAEEVVQKSGQLGVPVIIIKKEGKEKIITGFDKKELAEELVIK